MKPLGTAIILAACALAWMHSPACVTYVLMAAGGVAIFNIEGGE